jgi:hypothetical protein
MWFELKTKVQPILININYRSELQSHTFYWQFFDRQISDHDGTYVTFKCGFSNQKTYQRTIWD